MGEKKKVFHCWSSCSLSFEWDERRMTMRRGRKEMRVREQRNHQIKTLSLEEIYFVARQKEMERGNNEKQRHDIMEPKLIKNFLSYYWSHDCFLFFLLQFVTLPDSNQSWRVWFCLSHGTISIRGARSQTKSGPSKLQFFHLWKRFGTCSVGWTAWFPTTHLAHLPSTWKHWVGWKKCHCHWMGTIIGRLVMTFSNFRECFEHTLCH